MTPNNFRVKNGLTVGTTISGGNTTITGFVNATSTVNAAGLAVGTAFVANTTQVVFGTSTGLNANGGIGTAGQVLHSNGTSIYWAADDNAGGTVTSIATANGISGGTITTTGTIGVTTGSTLTVNSTGIHVNSALSIGDLILSGNLTVSGTRTYVNTTTLDVGDNIITLNADLGASAPSQDAGIEIMRGTSANVQFMWDETNDRWSTNNQPLAISSLVAAGAASGITTLAAGNTTITGFANVAFGSGGGLTGPSSGSWAGKIVTNQDTTAYNGLSVQNRWAAATSVIFEAAMGWNGAAAGYYPVFTVDGLGQVTINSNAPQAFVMGTYANGNVGFGNNAPAHKVSIAGTLAAGNTTITGFANVVSTGGAQAAIALRSGTYGAFVVPQASQGAYNNLVANTDNLLYFSNGTINGGNLVIGTWSDRAAGYGIKFTGSTYDLAITANTVTITSNTTHSGWVTASSARGAVATPTAGQNNSALYVTGSDTAYGLLFGADPATGKGWIQSQRTDGTATTYNLKLNPAGGAVEFGAGYNEAEVANTAATGTFTMNCSNANFFDLTLTGNITISPSNVPANGRVWSGSIAAKQDATGGRTITWPTGTKYAGGVAPPATTTANALDIWSLMTYDGGTSWIVSLSVKNAA